MGAEVDMDIRHLKGIIANVSKPRFFIKKVCAYCKADMGNQECAPENHGLTSHGICKNCVPVVEAELDRIKAK